MVSDVGGGYGYALQSGLGLCRVVGDGSGYLGSGCVFGFDFDFYFEFGFGFGLGLRVESSLILRVKVNIKGQY